MVRPSFSSKSNDMLVFTHSSIELIHCYSTLLWLGYFHFVWGISECKCVYKSHLGFSRGLLTPPTCKSFLCCNGFVDFFWWRFYNEFMSDICHRFIFSDYLVAAAVLLLLING